MSFQLRFKNISIQNKLILITGLVTSIAIILGFTLVTVLDIRAFKERMLENSRIMARVIGDYNINNLISKDRSEAIKSLGKLKSVDKIELAVLFDEKGQYFASFSNDNTTNIHKIVPPYSDKAFYRENYLHIYHNILLKNSKIGTIYLRQNNSELNLAIWNHILTLFFFYIFAISIAILLIIITQKSLTLPLHKLVNAVRRISNENNYGLRVKKEGNDEIGLLTDAFNDMMEQVESRQKKLISAEESVRSSESRFRTIIEHSNDPILVIHRNKIVFANPKFSDYFEYKAEEVIEENFAIARLSAESTRKRFTTRIINSDDTLHINRFEFTGESRSGKNIEFEAGLSPIRWDGKYSILAILRNISEHKKLQKTLEKFNTQLELLVEERTRDLKERTAELNQAYANIKRDLALAQMIQNKILSKDFEAIHNVNFSLVYEPMTEIGGDIYDIFELKPGVIRVFLADATGHGIQAALVTMIIKGEYEKLKTKIDKPSLLLEKLNNEFIEGYGLLNVYFSCVLIDLNTNQKHFTYSSAGHPGQYFIFPDRVESLRTPGKIIGIKEEIQFPQIEQSYEGRLKIILFTDGIYEQFNHKFEEYGDRRLSHIIHRTSKHKASRIVQAIQNDVQFFVGFERRVNENDDVTIIGIDIVDEND